MLLFQVYHFTDSEPYFSPTFLLKSALLISPFSFSDSSDLSIFFLFCPTLVPCLLFQPGLFFQVSLHMLYSPITSAPVVPFLFSLWWLTFSATLIIPEYTTPGASRAQVGSVQAGTLDVQHRAQQTHSWYSTSKRLTGLSLSLFFFLTTP